MQSCSFKNAAYESVCALDGEQNRTTGKFRDGQQFHSILKRSLEFEVENRQKGVIVQTIELSPHVNSV